MAPSNMGFCDRLLPNQGPLRKDFRGRDEDYMREDSASAAQRRFFDVP